jgi:hypothetical protein
MKPGRQTVANIIRFWTDEIMRREPPSFWLLGDLFDDFRQRCSTPEEKLALVRDAPVWLDERKHANCNAYLAAAVETLCR